MTDIYKVRYCNEYGNWEDLGIFENRDNAEKRLKEAIFNRLQWDEELTYDLEYDEPDWKERYSRGDFDLNEWSDIGYIRWSQLNITKRGKKYEY